MAAAASGAPMPTIARHAKLRARLPAAASPAEYLALPDPLDSSTWTLVCGDSSEQPLDSVLEWFLDTLQSPPEHVFVQVNIDDLGRHEYVCLHEVQEQTQKSTATGKAVTPLRIITEDEVKSLRRQAGDSVLVLNAALPQEQHLQAAEELGISDRELCPLGSVSRNYSVCEDLTLGRTQRIMLSDESTLRVGVERNGIKIFNYLTLIVNCHETSAANAPGKYSVGTAKPSIIFQPIHELMAAKSETVVKVMDTIQQRIWQCSQEGSVVVHCLAGVHRAPTVVVCQYLYRHYALRQTDVCNDVEKIYSRLRSVRPHVEPLGYIRLIRVYEEYLMSAFPPGTS